MSHVFTNSFLNDCNFVYIILVFYIQL